ncbi:hemerythrin domain-containing protein [Nonomuraea sp. NPDC049152]|uniref:hemerythrin domain-containing protein n=1 Tax=Nonomuraea sp. NPDC049152 TaxID=3154350 RepID=UPI0033FB4239
MNDEKPGIWEMAVVHRVFRREFGALPAYIRAVRAGDTDRAAVLAEHLQDMLTGLHHHHEAEDRMLWPLLLERASLEKDLIHTMEAQHERVAALIPAIEELVPGWVAEAAPARGERIAALVAELSDELDAHLQQEEEEILPLVTLHITVEEWERLGETGRDSIPKDKLLVSLGAILEEATPRERAAFLAKLPVVARIVWKLVGRRQYAAATNRIRTYA